MTLTFLFVKATDPYETKGGAVWRRKTSIAIILENDLITQVRKATEHAGQINSYSCVRTRLQTNRYRAVEYTFSLQWLKANLRPVRLSVYIDTLHVALHFLDRIA